MAGTKTPNKRPIEDGEQAAPVAKRGRGRPRKDPNAPPPPPKDPNAPKRGRGRPPKDPNALASSPKVSNASKVGGAKKDANGTTPAKSPKVPGRGRGRPPKDLNASTAKPKASSAPKGRGRPPKTDSAVSVAAKKDNAAKPGRGRPKKADSSAAPADKAGDTPAKGRGRPKKSDVSTGRTTPSSAKKNPSASEGKVMLTAVVGTYEINCEAVEGNWDGVSEDMRISISALPNTKSSLIASFDLGILEGTMLLAADEDTLEVVRRQFAANDAGQINKSPAPALKGRNIYFTWRGRNTGDDDEVHVGSCGTQTGILKFEDDKCTAFSGVGGFPALGSECNFQGTKVADEAEEEPEPWSAFNDEVYEYANKRRWG